MHLYTCLLTFLWILISLVGCNPFGQGNDTIKKVNQTNAFASLKIVNTTQNIYLMERERYARSVNVLSKAGYLYEGTMHRMITARNTEDGVPLSGYRFADIVEDETGRTLNDFRYGLVAYPEKPGETGDIMIIMLMDANKMEETTGRPKTDDMVQYWIALYAGEPVKRWPSEQELNSKFKRMNMMSPEQALKEAKAYQRMIK